MGESANRGVTQQTQNDVTRNSWAANNDQADDLAMLIPWSGVSPQIVSDAAGKFSFAHGLPFTPSVFVCSLLRSSGYQLSVQVFSITSTTITGYITHGDVGIQIAAGATNTRVHWTAFR